MSEFAVLQNSVEPEVGTSTLIIVGATVETIVGDWLSISDSGLIKVGKTVGRNTDREVSYPVRILGPGAWRDLTCTPPRVWISESETWTVVL